MERKRIKEELKEVVEDSNTIKELEGENRILWNLVKMLEVSPNCWCTRSQSVAYKKIEQAGIKLGHCAKCRKIREYLGIE